jgi:WXXGXW repeat (2 copies)
MQKTAVVPTLLFALTVTCVSITCMSTASSAQVGVGISVNFGPPALPVYEQPICPGDGYIWTPGYWAWDPDAGDYYWVPGTWILAPDVGYLWTPPWWGWEGGRFWFHEGWWGPHVGFYGGINYGFGYFGVGFIGGRWNGGHFFYNRAVSNVNVVNIRNVYNERVTINENHVSFNGGPGGVVARANAEQEAAAHERHIAAVSTQRTQIEQARANRELRASVNRGSPPVAATARAGEFSHEVVAAREAGGAYHPPAEGGGGAPRAENGGRTFGHPNELPPIEHRAPPNTGNAKLDQKYQQQQEKLYGKQNQERERLQAQQEKEHQQAQQRNYGGAQRQQMEQRHRQQTQQMQQHHQQQTQQLQQRQAPGGGKR